MATTCKARVAAAHAHYRTDPCHATRACLTLRRDARAGPDTTHILYPEAAVRRRQAPFLNVHVRGRLTDGTVLGRERPSDSGRLTPTAPHFRHRARRVRGRVGPAIFAIHHRGYARTTRRRDDRHRSPCVHVVGLPTSLELVEYCRASVPFSDAHPGLVPIGVALSIDPPLFERSSKAFAEGVVHSADQSRDICFG
jgi:hypothetical protein